LPPPQAPLIRLAGGREWVEFSGDHGLSDSGANVEVELQR
jgi:hypothetical protein